MSKYTIQSALIFENLANKKAINHCCFYTTLDSHLGLSMTHRFVLDVLSAFTLVLRERDTNTQTDSDQ